MTHSRTTDDRVGGAHALSELSEAIRVWRANRTSDNAQNVLAHVGASRRTLDEWVEAGLLSKKEVNTLRKSISGK